MKLRKSTIVLIAVIFITLVLGGVAVYTAVLLNQKKVREEAAQAAGGFCDYITVGSVNSQYQTDGKFSLSYTLTNPSAAIVTAKIQPLVFHCTDKCTTTPCEKICTGRLLYGDKSEEWKDVTIAAGATQTVTIPVADTGYDSSCGKIQFDEYFIDLKADGVRSDATGECMSKGLFATGIISGSTDCSAECAIEPVAVAGQSAGDTVDFEATVTPAEELVATNYDYAWDDGSTNGTFNPADELSTTYTIPAGATSPINVSFNSSYDILEPDNITSILDGSGYNTLPLGKMASTYYLPSVSNQFRGIGVDSITRPKTSSTDIFIYNPTGSSATATITFYSTGGGVSGTESVSIPANGTRLVSTDSSDVFGTTGFDGSATVATTGGSKIYVVYEKFYRGTNGETRVWGMEGMPSTSAGAFANLTPITNQGWGVDQTFVTVYNPGASAITVNYSLCGGWNDETTFDCNASWGGVLSIAAHGMQTIDVNSKITEPIDPLQINGGEEINSIDNPWRGQIGLAASSGTIAVVSEELWTDGVGGSNGYQARGRSNVFGSPFNDQKLCFVSMSKKVWGSDQTGYGYSDTTGPLAGPDVTTTMNYYNGFSGREAGASPSAIFTIPAYGNQIGWITGPGDGFYGSAIVSTETGKTIVGGIQDVGADSDFGRATSGIPCDTADLTTELYVTGLKNSLEYALTASIPVFNPTDTTETVRVTLYNADGTVATTADLYLVPYSTRPLLLAGLVPPNWYGSAKVAVVSPTSGNGIVAVNVSVNRTSTTAGIEALESTCSATITLGATDVLSCTLNVTPSTVVKGDAATGVLTITDGEFEAGTTYTATWADSPDAGTFAHDSQTMTTLTGTNAYTTSSSTTQTSTTITATVTKAGETPVTCTDTLTITDEPSSGFGCTSVDVSDSTPAKGQAVTATVNVYNPDNETVTYAWVDDPTTGGTFNPDDEDEVTYTVSATASGTIELSATVSAAGESDTCMTTMTVTTTGGDDDDDDQPDTAFFSPVLYMTGGGAALAGSGFLVARSGKVISGVVNRTSRTVRFKSKKFEERTLSSVARARRKVK